MSETRSDGELLRAIAADGDRRAFEELYRRYAPWLTARLRGRCADAGVVDDVVQETFLAMWRGKARYREEGRRRAGWLWRIGSRRLIDALRGDGARGRLRQALARLRHRDEASAEERVLAGVEHGDLAGALVQPVTRTPRGAPGHGHRRADHPRGGRPARHTTGDGQDTGDAGP